MKVLQYYYDGDLEHTWVGSQKDLEIKAFELAKEVVDGVEFADYSHFEEWCDDVEREAYPKYRFSIEEATKYSRDEEA